MGQGEHFRSGCVWSVGKGPRVLPPATDYGIFQPLSRFARGGEMLFCWMAKKGLMRTGPSRSSPPCCSLPLITFCIRNTRYRTGHRWDRSKRVINSRSGITARQMPSPPCSPATKRIIAAGTYSVERIGTSVSSGTAEAPIGSWRRKGRRVSSHPSG